MKKSKVIKYFLPVILAIFVLSGCATIYTNPDFTSARVKHKTLAILPFDVSIAVKKLPNGMTFEMLKEMEKDEAYVIQSEIYAYFLERLSKNKYTIDFQDIDTTNFLLSHSGITFESIRVHTKTEISKVLNADVVLSGTIHREKPMSTGVAVASAFLLGWSGPTNKIEAGVTIHDGATGKLLWKYNHSYAGGLGSSSQGVCKRLMKHVSQKFPYTKE